MRPMWQVVRHLVDEERFASAIDLGIGKVLLAQASQLLGGQLGDHSRIARGQLIMLATLQLLHQPRDIRQLHGALDF